MSTRTRQAVDWTPLTDASETERLLWVLVAVALMGDVATTLVGLELGLAESNPIARSAIDGWGVLGMLTLKAGAIGVAIACRPFVDAAYRPIVPAALAIPWGAAVVVNLYTLSVVV
ncbi:DUF5658 family protein [Halovivax limisalsi]|uniref:DUF5658 family protein n=1 Tax=Halovivax limisalsi TaxID=1453760 RepID=UPI001FFC8C2F|nr:DUF5658 family protein [Halovivax limisalsi]